jgi:hypothetical protein
MASTYIKDLLVKQIMEINEEIDSIDQERVNLTSLLATCEDRYNKSVDKKTDIIEKLKLIDPEGVYS